MRLNFDLLDIVAANWGQLFPVCNLLFLFLFEKKVEVVEFNCCPFGAFVQNGRQGRRFERIAFVLSDECDRLWVFVGDCKFSSLGIIAILHNPRSPIAELSIFDHYFIPQFLRKNLFILYIIFKYFLQEEENKRLGIFCQHLLQKGEKSLLLDFLWSLLLDFLQQNKQNAL